MKAEALGVKEPQLHRHRKLPRKFDEGTLQEVLF